jgi:hypothetical protein
MIAAIATTSISSKTVKPLLACVRKPHSFARRLRAIRVPLRTSGGTHSRLSRARFRSAALRSRLHTSQRDSHRAAAAR